MGEESLTEQAYTALRTRIVTCELPPGASVTERELARTTPYGLTPIRRALARLDRDGLVVTVPRTGYVVTPLDADRVSELVEAWDVVGPELVRLGLARLSAARAEELTRLLARWSPPGAAVEDRPARVLRFSELSREVFALLAAASGNRWLRSTFEQLADQMARLWVVLLRDPEVPDDLAHLMDRWDADIAGRRPDEIVDALPRLIRQSGRTALDLFRRRA